MFSLSGKISMVTGGTGLLGKEIVRALGEAGSRVYLGSRSEKRASPVVETLRSEGLDIHPLPFDISQEDSIKRAADYLSRQEPRLDILVNAAANRDLPFKKLEDITSDDWLNLMQVDLIGAFLCAQQFYPMLARSSGSCIINIASIYGITAVDQRIYEGANAVKPTPITYAAAKAALINMTKNLAVYWREHNIRVNVISPGGFFNNQPQEFIDAYSYRVPLQRMGLPNELKGAVVFLASDEASYITGHNLVVDGGWTAW